MATWFRRVPPGPGGLRRIVRSAAERLRLRGLPGRRSAGRLDPARITEHLASVRVTERTAGRLHRAAAGLAEVTSEVHAYAELLEEKADELRARARAQERTAGPR
ncbi:hypothetical protein ACFOWE_06580 [Planomonospora corallina]|uniref:Uncharacterized protein n=1 Tax=Planomonospora corallina TaxID=1806052 RepID=A0ABV8I187_9ACTN